MSVYTCLLVSPGDHQTPPEWEQDPNCPQHPADRRPDHQEVTDMTTDDWKNTNETGGDRDE